MYAFEAVVVAYFGRGRVCATTIHLYQSSYDDCDRVRKTTYFAISEELNEDKFLVGV